VNQPAPIRETRGLAHEASRFGAATMLSRVLGLVREQMFAALVGAGPFADAFVVAFRIPNMLRDLFAEGALSAAFVPTFTDYLANRTREEAWALANKVVNIILVLLGSLVLLGMIFSRQVVHVLAAQFTPEKAELAAHLTRIMLPFLTLAAIVITANHYFLDAVGGAIIFGAALLIQGAWERHVVRRRERRDPPEEVSTPPPDAPVEQLGGVSTG